WTPSVTGPRPERAAGGSIRPSRAPPSPSPSLPSLGRLFASSDGRGASRFDNSPGRGPSGRYGVRLLVRDLPQQSLVADGDLPVAGVDRSQALELADDLRRRLTRGAYGVREVTVSKANRRRAVAAALG